MHTVKLSNDDLIFMYNLENRFLALAILDTIEDYGIELTTREDIESILLYTYENSNPNPLSAMEIREIEIEEFLGGTNQQLAYYDVYTFAICPGGELLEYMR